MSVKKILALLLAAMMVFGMTSALAANGVNLNATDTKTMQIPITQTLYFKNADGVAVYEPNLYYSYTITPGEAGATVKDHAGVSASVKAGDMRAFGLTTVTGTKEFGINFSSDHKKVTANAAGTVAVTKKVTVNYDGAALVTEDNVPTPGVYRYIITQTTTPEQKNLVGVEEVGTQDKTLVLDVYVNNEGEVIGSVIHDPNPTNPDSNNPSVDNSEDADGDGKDDDPTDTKDDENGKQTGFGDPDPDGEDPTFTNEEPADTTPDDPNKPEGDKQDPTGQQSATTTADTLPAYHDMYTTYNVTATKTVDGAMGDKSNFFPFQVALTNSIHGASFDYTVTSNGSGNVALTEAVVEKTSGGTGNTGNLTLGALTATSNIKLKDTGVITITGVPSIVGGNVTAKIDENNNTGDTYKVTAKFTDSSSGSASVSYLIAGTSDSSPTADLATTVSTDTTAKSIKLTATPAFTFNNNLPEISPTGVVLRFAPYFAMFAAGCVLFLILATKRSKKEEE